MRVHGGHGRHGGDGRRVVLGVLQFLLLQELVSLLHLLPLLGSSVLKPDLDLRGIKDSGEVMSLKRVAVTDNVTDCYGY